MMSRFFVASVACLLAIGYIGCIQSEQIHGIDGFDPKVKAEIGSLASQFEKLNSILKKKLTKTPEYRENNEKIIELAKAEITGCIGSRLSLGGSLNKAINLFVALESTAGRCDTESFEILAKNQVALRAVVAKYKFEYVSAGIIGDVIKYYRALHAEHCRPVHRQRFYEAAKELPVEDLEKLEKLENAFSNLNIYDFGYPHESFEIRYQFNPFDLVGMHQTDIVNYEDERVLRKIAGKIKESQGLSWKNTGKKVDYAELKPTLDEVLFKPCESFRSALSKILDEARFDASVEDGKAQREFIHGDERFYRALISNRLCDMLLKEKDDLHERFTYSWNKAWF